MITRSRRRVQGVAIPATRETLIDAEALALRLGTTPERLGHDAEAAAGFTLKAPTDFVARIDPHDPDDPLLRQILPVADENQATPGFVDDPVGDLDATVAPGLIHKYRGRALLIATAACAIHCRYCFRRNYPYREQRLDLDRIRAYLLADPSIRELILSGGDPLTLSNTRLAELIELAEGVPHLRTLRIHSRVPVARPRRLDDELLARLADSRLNGVLVIHANHPNEVDDAVAAVCHAARANGLLLLNQSVLLRGVNDDPGVLAALSHRLFDAGVLPYYLHLLDRAAGVAHFEIEEEQARAIHRRLRERLPGYLLPRLVREIAGETAKSPVCASPFDGGTTR